jgi:hypothetical protein
MLEGLLLLLVTVVVASGIFFPDVAPTDGGADDANGFVEYVDSSCSAATRED